MIVWGGTATRTLLATRRAFDPATRGAGRAIDAARASARGNHRPVWTGTEMIVWGGSNGIGLSHERRALRPDDGYVDCRRSARTRPIAHEHTAVWTGTEMIVWGGATRVEYARGIDTGGRYAPSADRWRPTNGSGTPLARRDHSVVWTGEQMILWSGEGGGSSGGRYCASCAWARRYHDADGDGRGDPGKRRRTAAGPSRDWSWTGPVRRRERHGSPCRGKCATWRSRPTTRR